jgi:hypothetical protein
MASQKFIFIPAAVLLSAWVTACGGGQGAGGSIAPLANTTVVTIDQQLRVGIGINALTYYDRSFAMADLSKHSRFLGMDFSANAGIDANGNPGKDFIMMYSAEKTKIGAGTYRLTFSGKATVTARGGGYTQNASYDKNTNLSKADIVLPSDETGNVFLIFKDTTRSGITGQGDGVTNIHLWRPGYATDGSALFTTEFVSAMKKFRLIRGMDFVNANNNPQRTWAERTTPDFAGFTGDNGQSWELLIALANATDRDVWLNVPVRADEDYIRKLAQLVKYGSDGSLPYSSLQNSPRYAPLKAGLKVYIEYGNEVWNFAPGFKGFRWALDLTNLYRADVSHPIAFDGAQADQYAALRRWIAFRSSILSLTFRDVFGDAAMMKTVRPIFSTQVGNANTYLSSGLQWAQAFYGQVRQTAPLNAVVRKPSDIWYGGGGAAYYNSSSDPKNTYPATMDKYFADLPTPNFTNTSTTDSIWTHAYGLNYVAYEGGPNPGETTAQNSGGAEISQAANNDPRMKDRMLVAQDIWDRVGGDELNYFIYSGSAPWTFSNEREQQTVSDNNSVKLQAIDAINAKGKSATTIGSSVPNRIYLKDPSSQAIGSDPATWALNGTVYLLRQTPTGNPYILVPIRATSGGKYTVSLNIGAKVAGTVSLFVNGDSYGTINLAPDATNTATVSSKVVVTLPAGLSVLRLDTPKADGDIFVKDLVVE